MDRHLALTPAVLIWNDAGYPSSRYYNDIYFNNENGLEESKYIFLQQNHLPKYFFTSEKKRITLAETGFGTGLNFLLTMQVFLQAQSQGAAIQRLHFISIEKHPLQAKDLKKALSQWPSLQQEANELLAVYPTLTPGCHRCHLGQGKVTLDLWFGDVRDCLRAMWAPVQGLIDIWYLDGFAPSKNPCMWHEALYRQMARLSKPQASLATFTSAGHVRRGLLSAGFAVEKVPGFGHKREMLRATFTGKANINDKISSCHHNNDNHLITIIGGGIASAALAVSLTRRGLPVEILCADETIAQGASGNRQGVIYPLLSPHEPQLTYFSQTAFLYTKQVLAQLNTHHQFRHQWCGVMQMGFDTKSHAKISRLAQANVNPSIMIPLDAQTASDIAGVPCGSSLFYPTGGWVCAYELTQALFDSACQTGLCQIHYQQKVNDIQAKAQGWELTIGKKRKHAQQLILANGHAIKHFEMTKNLPVYPVRGQISHVQQTSESSALKSVLCAKGYLTPAMDNKHCAGASYQRNRQDTHLCLQEQNNNKKRLHQSFAQFDWVKSLDFSALDARASVRCANRDHLPLIGSLPDTQQLTMDNVYTTLPSPKSYQYPDLYLLCGLGSRGLTTALLSAEILSAYLCAEPMPIEETLMQALTPERFWIRRWQKHFKQLQAQRSKLVQSHVNHRPNHNLQHQK